MGGEIAGIGDVSADGLANQHLVSAAEVWGLGHVLLGKGAFCELNAREVRGEGGRCPDVLVWSAFSYVSAHSIHVASQQRLVRKCFVERTLVS